MKWLLTFLLILVTIIGSIPSLLSTDFGKPFVVKGLEQIFNRRIEIEKISLSWFGKQTFTGVKVSDEAFEYPMQSLIFELPLYRFLNSDIKQIEIAKGTFEIGKVPVHLFNKKPVIATFSPAEFSLSEGKIHIKKFSFKILSRYEFSLMGKINLIKDKVSLMLGVPGTYLNIETEEITIPIKGKIGEISFDEKILAKKLAENLLINYRKVQ